MNIFQVFSNHVKPYFFLLASAFLLVSCGGGNNLASNDETTEQKFTNLAPYQTSQYSAVLKECVTVTKSEESCLLSKLPLIGQQTNSPTDADILDRLIVSHPWMGDNFKRALRFMPNDMRLMFRSVTAIVIDEGIRPSFYTPRTAAIYLDPANVWLTNIQKEDIIKDEDFRTGFGNDLLFKEFNILTREGRVAFDTRGKIDNTIERTIIDVLGPLSALLFHELAHANDYILPNEISNILSTDTVYEAISKQYDNQKTASHHLFNNMPLRSSVLFSLAKVRFRGETPTDTEKNMSAYFVGQRFESEGAVMHYGYNTVREDVATLLEAGMMKMHFGLDRDQFFVEYSPTTTYDNICSYKVATGSRNRIAKAETKVRMLSVLDDIFPDGTHRVVLDLWLESDTLKTRNGSVCDSIFAYQKKSTKSKSATGVEYNLNNLSPDAFFVAPHDSSSR
jgi:hypothetical protein